MEIAMLFVNRLPQVWHQVIIEDYVISQSNWPGIKDFQQEASQTVTWFFKLLIIVLFLPTLEV